MSGSLDGSCILPAAGKDWHFKLTIGQWMKLQKAFGNIGPTRINERFDSQDWTIENVREVIERGLEGGGLAPADCGATATGIIDAQPLTQNLQLAVDIITAGWTGMDELLKKSSHRGNDVSPIEDADGQWRFGDILGTGLLLKIQPSEIKQLSFWEYFSMTDFWLEAHSRKDGKLSEPEKDEIWEWMQSKPDQVPLTLAEARKKMNGH